MVFPRYSPRLLRILKVKSPCGDREGNPGAVLEANPRQTDADVKPLPMVTIVWILWVNWSPIVCRTTVGRSSKSTLTSNFTPKLPPWTEPPTPINITGINGPIVVGV
jgi:hypothetical protein